MMKLTVISPEKLILETQTDFVELPGTLGRFVILASHAPLVSSLTEGVVRYRVDGKDETVGILSGFVEVKNDVITVCVEQ